MTEEPAATTQPSEPLTLKCVHCGATNTNADVDPAEDWLCRACERYQDSAICPSCGSVVRATILKERGVAVDG